MKHIFTLENGVIWLVNEDGEKVTYMDDEQLDAAITSGKFIQWEKAKLEEERKAQGGMK